jgi:hypothetical protein
MPSSPYLEAVIDSSGREAFASRKFSKVKIGTSKPRN